MNVQEGRVQVSVYLFFERGGDTFEGAADRDSSLEILDTLDKVVGAVQWLQGDQWSPLTQIADEDLTDQYQRPVYRLSFTTLTYYELEKPNYVLLNNR